MNLTEAEDQKEWIEEYAEELVDLARTGHEDAEQGVILVAAGEDVSPKAAWRDGTMFLEQVEPPLDYDKETQFIVRFMWKDGDVVKRVDCRCQYPVQTPTR